MGTCKVGGKTLTIEDLPGATPSDRLSPDEQIVHDVLTGTSTTVSAPDAWSSSSTPRPCSAA